MSNSYFEFKRFTVHQEGCAMKVGTDGTLLGAWAQVPSAPGSSRILDIGTGTGLIALMMAQRFPDSQVLGIDIDADAVAQAKKNVEASPFSSRINIQLADIRELQSPEPFDAIVSNPPYFVDSLTCPDDQRTTARHAVNLSYAELMKASFRLLSNDGFFSVVIPTDCRSRLEAEAHLEGFFPSRLCMIKTTPNKTPKRCLIEFTKHPVDEYVTSEGIIEDKPGKRSDWYQQLTSEFYIK